MRKQADFLNHVSDAAAKLDEIPIGGGAIVNQHLAIGGKQQAVEHLQRCGLSRAAAAQQHQRTAGFHDAKVKLVQDEIAADTVRDFAELQGGRAIGARGSSTVQRFSAKGHSSIDPLAFDLESGLLRHGVEFQELKFVRGLGPDGLTGAEGHGEIGFGDERGLIQCASAGAFRCGVALRSSGPGARSRAAGNRRPARD